MNRTANVAASAADSAGAQLLKALLTELRMQSPRFASMNEEEQQLVIDRLRNTVESEIDLLVARIACRSFPAGAAVIQKLQIVDKKARCTLDFPQSFSLIHDVADHVGGSCWLVLCEPEEFTGGLSAVKPMPNQQSLLPPDPPATPDDDDDDDDE